MIDEDLVALTIENYQYVWKKTQGTEVSKSLHGFHAHLQEDLCFDLYSNTFKRTQFFCEADNSFFRLMGVLIREMYFKKDAKIMQCNDVQGFVYIVYNGKVDISMAATKLCTLERGGMFGSFKGKPKTRQTISATAKVHVGLLVVDGIEFHKVKWRWRVYFENLGKLNVNILDCVAVSSYFNESKECKFFKCGICRSERWG